MKIVRKERTLLREVVITSAVRTAIGNFLGALSPFSATELGGKVIDEAVKRSRIEKKLREEMPKSKIEEKLPEVPRRMP
jgi:acetyl-CoA acetyltransferase